MNEIIIQDTELSKHRVTSSFSVSKKLEKYIKNHNFFAEYDVDVTADKSILNIPITSVILPLAWLTGSNIYVDEIDYAFKESMEEVKKEYMKMYPKIPFTTEIKADKVVENKNRVDPSERTGLLFSGGIDSTYSLVSNLRLKPRMIMIWGIEGHPYPKYLDYWKNVISTYSNRRRNDA